MTHMSAAEVQLAQALQNDLPLSARPFREIARRVGSSEEAVIETLQRWQHQGVLRRVGAVLHHRRAGFVANGLSLWAVPSGRLAEAGARAAAFPEVGHCIERRTPPGWPWNLFVMIHGRTRADVSETARRISRTIDTADYEILFTVREFKKVSMRCFTEPDRREQEET